MRPLLLALIPLAPLLVALPSGAQQRPPTQRMPDDERGALLYERHCVQCHGPTLAGDGPAAGELVAEVPDLRGALHRDRRALLVPIVLDGQGAMPGYRASFDAHDARRILRHMERLPLPERGDDE